jgi:hypothetical protein
MPSRGPATSTPWKLYVLQGYSGWSYCSSLCTSSMVAQARLKPPRRVPLSRRRSELSMRLSRSRITNILMLVLGILSVPSVGARAMQGPHCAKHEQPTLHPAHQASSAHPESVQPGTPHDCPHCPARECAHVVPCATSTSPVTAAASLVVTESSPGHVGVRTVRTHARSRTHEPPTPPPQLIA